MIVVRIFQALFCGLGIILLGACVWTASEIDGNSTSLTSWTCTADVPSPNQPTIQNCITDFGTTDSTATKSLGSTIAVGLAGIGSLLIAVVLGSARGSTAATVPMQAMGPSWAGPPGAYLGPPPPGWVGPTAQSSGPPPMGAAPGSAGPGT